MVGAVDAAGVTAVFVLLLATGALVTGVVEGTLTAVIATLAVEVAGGAANELTLVLPLFSTWTGVTNGSALVVANWAAELLVAALAVALRGSGTGTAVALALVA